MPEATRNNYALLRTELTKQLQPVESPRFCANLLYAPRKQGNIEKVAAYGAEIQRLARGAHPITDTFSAEAQDNIMRDVFISGLKGSDYNGLKARVLEKDPRTFEMALDCALKAEARGWLLEGTNPIIPKSESDTKNIEIHSIDSVNTFSNRRFPNYSWQRTSPQNYNRTNMNLRRPNTWQQNQSNWRQIQPNFRFNYTPNQTKYCTYCSHQGHTYRECRTRQCESLQPIKQCNYCSRKGHNYEECRTRQRDQNTSSQRPQARPPVGQFSNRNQQFSNRGRNTQFMNKQRANPNQQQNRTYHTAALNMEEKATPHSNTPSDVSRTCAEILTTFKNMQHQQASDLHTQIPFQTSQPTTD